MDTEVGEGGGRRLSLKAGQRGLVLPVKDDDESLGARAGRRAPAALRPLAFVGRHTLAVYMAHQPVLYGALWLWHALPVTNC